MATTNEQDLLWVYNPTKAPFTVKWGGYPYTLESGEKKVMPRFIAEHFAKHLADAILMRKEENIFEKSGKRQPLIQHPIERPRIVNMIIIGVYTYFQKQNDDAGSVIASIVDQANQGIDSSQAPTVPQDDGDYEDYGLIPDKAVGNLDVPPAPVSDLDSPVVPDPTQTPVNDGQLADEVPVSKVPPQFIKKPGQKTKAQLMEEADKLGITYTTKSTVPELERAIANF